MGSVVTENRAGRAQVSRLGERTMSRVVRYVRNGSVEDAPATGVGRSSDVKLTGKVVYDFQRDPPFDEARTLDRIRTWIRHVDSATAAEARMKNDSELSD